MTTKKGAWNLQDVRDKQLQQALWAYNAPGDPSRFFSLGNDQYGTLGRGDGIPRSSPVQVQGTWDKLFTNGPQARNFAFASKESGTLYAWGGNYQGQLGQNDRAAHTTPVQIPGTNWSKVEVSNNHVAAIKTDGTLWTWGRNEYGGLGHNNRQDYSSPTQIPGTNWSDVVAASDDYTLATKTNGELWAWGRNTYGQLGTSDSPTENRSSPCQVPGTSWSTVNSGDSLSCGIKTNGELWTWGRNANGGLGINQSYAAANYRNSPKQVPGTNWTSAHAGSGAMIATRTDGTLWMWGMNDQGHLGQNSVVNYSSPVQVGSGTDWVKTRNGVRAGNSTRALKTDGTFWNWGYNFHGSLGQNEGGEPATLYSSPVQIPGTWADFNATDRWTHLLSPS